MLVHMDIGMNIEAETAEQFVKYADLIVGFVVLQGLSFAYALGQTGALRNAIVRGRAKILWIIIVTGLFYEGLVFGCASCELLLRHAANHPDVVLLVSCSAALGRGAIVLIATALAYYGLYLNRDGKLMKPLAPSCEVAPNPK